MPAQIPDYSKTALLLPFKGADGSQAFVDQGPLSRSISVAGQAAHSNSVSKFYGSSCFFDGFGDYLTVTYTLPSIWTVRCWIYVTSLTATRPIFFNGNSAINANRYLVQVLADGRLSLYAEAGSGTAAIDVYSSTGAITTGAWHHIEANRNGSSSSIFLNGQMVASGTLSETPSLPSTFYIGLGRQGGSERNFNGYMNDFEIVDGVVLNSTNFTPPPRLLGSVSTTSSNPIMGPDNMPAVRTIVAVPRQYPRRVRTTASASDGSFSIELPCAEHTLLYLDDDAGDIYNDLCHRVIPE